MLLWMHAHAITSGGNGMRIHEPLHPTCREQAAQARVEADTVAVREFSAAAARVTQNSKRPRGPAEEHILAAQAASKRARIEARYSQSPAVPSAAPGADLQYQTLERFISQKQV